MLEESSAFKRYRESEKCEENEVQNKMGYNKILESGKISFEEENYSRNSGLRIIIAIILSILAPLIITTLISGDAYKNSEIIQKMKSGKDVIVKDNGQNVVIDLEQYILGVLAAEYSDDINEENINILSAKAVLLRTELIYKMQDKDIIEATELGHTYYDYEDMKKIWDKNSYERNLKILEEIIVSTAGKTE